MRFKRFFAIILLLILPLQSTLAAIDSCCNRAADQQVLGIEAAIDQAGEQTDNSTTSDEANCCALCDFCNHASASFNAAPQNLRVAVLGAAPVPHPDFPIDSFIPEIPSRPDRA